ncbi:MAG: SAM-dependent methyltransferase [Phormidesmis sp. RL_2_1]|nr:SAM-dependent methyltransferase [Phormidesmis sp. RL_2_1]
MRLFTFLVIEVLLLPVSLIGCSLAVLWAIAISQQKQLSFTALSPLAGRWLLHQQGIRLDAATDSLVKHLPSVNGALSLMGLGPTLLATGISDYKLLSVPAPGSETLLTAITARTVFFDRALAQSLAEQPAVEQIVVLGAGFDTRLFTQCLDQNLALFEVDQLEIQQVKQQALQKSGVDLSEIHFVTVNFNQGDWEEKLIAAGFVRGRKTFFLWEGVTYYLTEAVVQRTLQKMADICGEGSSLAFDFFSWRLITGSDAWWLYLGVSLLDWLGEPFQFGIDTDKGAESQLSRVLLSAGFQLSELQLMGTAQPTGPFGGLVIARRHL